MPTCTKTSEDQYRERKPWNFVPEILTDEFADNHMF